MRLRFFLFSLILSAALLLAGRYGWQRIERWGTEPIQLSEPKVFNVPRGTSLQALAATLQREGLLTNKELFRVWVRLFADYSRFQAGLYRLEGSVSPQQIADVISRGDIYTPVVLELTIPEGFTLKQIAARLAGNELGTEEEFFALAQNKEFLRSLKIEADSLEGYFYPATYRFSKMPSIEEVIRHAVQTFWKKLPDGYEAAIAELNLTLTEAVTFASLIELETAHEDEKPFVSEVIWNRLNNNEALAIDASIIYGIEDYRGNLTRKHLQDRSNPYNSRVHPGLPPTPICSPSVSSLEAILTPSKKGFYFYVLDPTQGNRHHFSKTLREHNIYVRKLVKAQREARKRERRATRQ